MFKSLKKILKSIMNNTVPAHFKTRFHIISPQLRRNDINIRKIVNSFKFVLIFELL